MINKLVDNIFYKITYCYGEGKCDGAPESYTQLFIVYCHIFTKDVEFEDQNINNESYEKRENGESNELAYRDWHDKVENVVGNEIGYCESDDNC